ncbi:threonine synthase [Oceanicella actignis]|uniref:Threonine synthase n=1 Tax=Oceanicella actignis TaxID=1189325 RepID=A0A1M7T993_9RHOB|nr:threonine synthase [Oceanicella actignis]TYO89117.1 threonine synthase [Oceanicella actignis]SET50272.1 threonine synthase [Oceanicella actignis]SHN67241.1 threonine synthase [Oceanicella actignis]
MKYISTRGAAPALSFEETMLTGLARDGGLYVPESWPRMSRDEIAALAGLEYEEVAHRVMRPFVGDAFAEDELRAIIADAYASFDHPARCPLVQIGANEWIQELHHGPTLAFKDVAMQLIGRLFQASLARRGERVTIIGATSGDTGSAAIEAFRGLDAAEVFILFPKGRVSEVQRRQMTTPADANVHALAVEGDFDDCQALVKAAFNDHAFRDRARLAAVNSINWARVLAQTVYYFTAATALGAPWRAVSFSVPTGNFGDIFAGYVARRMGLPIGRLVIATNRNDILHRTVQSGEHRRQGVAPTISPSMDIQVSSNFERLLFDLLDRDGPAVARLMDELRGQGGFSLPQGALERLRAEFDSARCDEDQTLATIADIHAATGLVIDPHTAVGVHAARAARGDRAAPMVVLGTAHAAKFPDAVERACGVRPALPARMADLFERPERVRDLPNDLDALRRAVLSALEGDGA